MRSMKKMFLAAAAAAMMLASALTVCAADGTWQMDDNGWWYAFDGGGYAKDGWQEINGKQYCFNEQGYLYTDTVTPDGYFVDASGAWDGGEAFTAYELPIYLADNGFHYEDRTDTLNYGYYAANTAVKFYPSSVKDCGGYYEVTADVSRTWYDWTGVEYEAEALKREYLATTQVRISKNAAVRGYEFTISEMSSAYTVVAAPSGYYELAYLDITSADMLKSILTKYPEYDTYGGMEPLYDCNGYVIMLQMQLAG